MPSIFAIKVTRQECIDKYLPERVACYDSGHPSDCAPLPIPEEAYPTQELNERGYALVHLRNTPNTQIYAVTDNTAFSLIVLDMPAKSVDASIIDNSNNHDNNNQQSRNEGERSVRRKLGSFKGVSLKTFEHHIMHKNNRILRKAKKSQSRKRNKRRPQHDVRREGEAQADSFEEGDTLLMVEDSMEEEMTTTKAPTGAPNGLDTNAPTFGDESVPPQHDMDVEATDESLSPIQDHIDPNRVYIAIIDHPEAFSRRDPSTSEIGGNLNLMALEEILSLHGHEKPDIAGVTLIYTHGHTDHTGGANVTFPTLKDEWKIPDVTILATDSVLETYKKLIDLDLWTNRAPLPTDTIDEEMPLILPIGSNTVLNLSPTDGHTNQDSQDLMIYIEPDGDEPPILLYVDAIYPQWSPFFRFGADDLLSYIILHDKLLQFDLKDDGIFIGGHVNQLGTRQDILASQDLVNAVLDWSAEALRVTDINPMAAELGFFDPTSVYYNNRWALFRRYLTRLNNHCAKLVVEEFGCHLAGIDAVADSLCDVGQNFWSIVR